MVDTQLLNLANILMDKRKAQNNATGYKSVCNSDHINKVFFRILHNIGSFINFMSFVY